MYSPHPHTRREETRCRGAESLFCGPFLEKKPAALTLCLPWGPPVHAGNELPYQLPPTPSKDEPQTHRGTQDTVKLPQDTSRHI